MNIEHIKERLSEAFKETLGITKNRANQLLPSNLTTGKAYEAYILSIVCEKLRDEEGCELFLKGGSSLVLKTSAGKINRNYPWIEVRRSGKVLGELFTDIEFLAMSYSMRKFNRNPTMGEYHELDIVLVKYGATDRPSHKQLLLGVECKHTQYQKSLLKEVLGVRREMGLLSKIEKTAFNFWPSNSVNFDPSSYLMVFSSSDKVSGYQAPGEIYGIDFVHQPMP